MAENKRYHVRAWVNDSIDFVIEAGSHNEVKDKCNEVVEKFRSKVEIQMTLNEVRKDGREQNGSSSQNVREEIGRRIQSTEHAWG